MEFVIYILNKKKFSRECKCFARELSFLGNVIVLHENANVLRANTTVFGECNSFARERKCFASEHVFWGNLTVL